MAAEQHAHFPSEADFAGGTREVSSHSFNFSANLALALAQRDFPITSFSSINSGKETKKVIIGFETPEAKATFNRTMQEINLVPELVAMFRASEGLLDVKTEGVENWEAEFNLFSDPDKNRFFADKLIALSDRRRAQIYRSSAEFYQQQLEELQSTGRQNGHAVESFEERARLNREMVEQAERRASSALQRQPQMTREEFIEGIVAGIDLLDRKRVKTPYFEPFTPEEKERIRVQAEKFAAETPIPDHLKGK